MTEFPSLYKFTHGEKFISFSDVKSRSIEIKTKTHHVHQVPDYLFDQLDVMFSISGLIDWLSDMDPESRKRAIKELSDFADGLEMGEVIS